MDPQMVKADGTKLILWAIAEMIKGWKRGIPK
jgi:hypothetical protein